MAGSGSAARALAIAAFVSAFASSLSAAPGVGAKAGAVPASLTRAILSKGPDAVRGLPFFSPNAIPALRAEYFLVPSGGAPPDAAGAVESGRSDPTLRMWYSRAPIVFGPGWTRTALSERRAYLLGRGAGTVLALAADRYTLFFELPEDAPAFRSFALSFDSRFILYFENAPSDAELSFPAFVDLR